MAKKDIVNTTTDKKAENVSATQDTTNVTIDKKTESSLVTKDADNITADKKVENSLVTSEHSQTEITEVATNVPNNVQQQLEELGYGIHDKSLCILKLKQNSTTGETEKEYFPISNVLPVTSEQITYKNGRDEDVSYIVDGILTDVNMRLPSITVSLDELNRTSYIYNPKWKRMAILKPVPFAEKNLRYIVDSISKNLMKCSEVYTHTGFTRINGKLVYLYHGGVIGDVKDVNVDLSRDGLEQYHFTEKEFDLQTALKTSYSILDVADVKITIPLLATIYLAPLVTILREVGIFADYILWVEGKTGSRKSSLIAMSLSHFGTFTRNTFNCSFRDTTNSLEKKSFILKDIVVCIDDLNPEVTGTGKMGMAEKLFAMYGDRTFRGRLSSNGQTLKVSYTARGLAIVTAECFPDVAQSRLARAIIVDIKPDSIDLNKLRYLQENTELLSFAMKKFILWIIKDEESIIPEVKEMYKNLEIQTQTNKNHGRTNEAVNVMNIGFYLFLKFLHENKIISDDELKEKMDLCSNTLNELARRQNVEMQSESPVNMFKEAIEQLCETEKVQILNANEPINLLQNRTLIGYVDNEKELYYFLPNVLYKEVVKFYNEQGIKFPISKPALLKYLENEGYLYRTPKSDRRTVKKKFRNSTLAVIAIYKNKLGLSAEEDLDIEEVNKAYEQVKKDLNQTKK